jgi:hypothetical protein
MMGVLIQWGQGTRLICGKAVRFGDTLGNGSPLSSGHAGSGPSNIRRWIIENDWLDAIAQPGCGNLLSHLGTRRKPE